MRALLIHHHHLYILVSWLHHVQQCFHHQLHSFLVWWLVLVVLLQVLTHLLWVSSTWVCSPFWKWTWWISIVKVRFSLGVKTGNQSWYSEWPNTSSLCIWLLGLCDILWQIFNSWIIVVVEAIWLCLYSGFIGEDSPIGCESWISHKNVLIKLNYFLYGSSFLQFSDCFFLYYVISNLNSKNYSIFGY